MSKHLTLAVKESLESFVAGKGENPLDKFSLEQVREAAGDQIFSGLLKNTANKRMVKAYVMAGSTWSKIVNKPFGNAKDFKEKTLVRIEEMARLRIVGKREDVPMDFVGEASGTYKVNSYEAGYQFNRQDIINDDLGAFLRFPAKQGAAAARTIDKFVWDFVNDNVAVGIDGAALFSSSHNNIMTTSPLSTANLSIARYKLRSQTEAKTGDKLNLRGTMLIVPLSLEDLAYRLVNAQQLAQTSNNDANPFKNLEIVAVPWLTDTGVASTADWYLAADSSQIETIQIDFLKGKQTPQTIMRTGNTDSDGDYDFDSRSKAFKTRYEFGGILEDYRWIVKGDAV